MVMPVATVVGVFTDRPDAERAVDALEEAGFTNEQIGFLAHDRPGSPADRAEPPGSLTDPDADGVDEHVGPARGAAMGVGLGAVLGALGALVIPGIGPAVAGGILATAIGGAITGAATGAVVGGVAGGLMALQVPEDEARYYDTEFQAGRTLVMVQADGRATEAQAILRRFGAYDTERRAA